MFPIPRFVYMLDIHAGYSFWSPPVVWGVIWLLIAFIFFAAGILVRIVAFKVQYTAFFVFKAMFLIDTSRNWPQCRRNNHRISSLLQDPAERYPGPRCLLTSSFLLLPYSGSFLLCRVD